MGNDRTLTIRFAADGSDDDLRAVFARLSAGEKNGRAKELLRTGLGAPVPPPIVQLSHPDLVRLIEEAMVRAVRSAMEGYGGRPPEPKPPGSSKEFDSSTADEV